MNREYDLLGKRYLELASLAAEAFRGPETRILDLIKINGKRRLFHLDISYPMSLTNHTKGEAHISREIVLGYNEDFAARVLPFYREKLCRMIGAERLRNGRSIVIKNPGKISYTSLFICGENRFNVTWSYPDEEVSGRQNWFFTQFKSGNLTFMFSEFFDLGKLSEPRELEEKDPKNLKKILDETEPWLRELVLPR